MYPILIQIGPIAIYTYGILVSIGFVICMVFINYLSKKANLNVAFFLDYIISIVVVSMLISRIVHVLLKFETYQLNPQQVFYIWDGGFSFWGALIGFLGYFFYLCLKHHQPFLRWIDAITPALLSLLFFSFLGFFFSFGSFSNRGFGLPTDMPWGMEVDILNSPYARLALHPLSLYFVAISAVTLIDTLILRKFKLPDGFAFLYSLLSFAIVALIVEFLKWDATYTVGGISFDLIMSIIATTFSVAGIIWIFYKAKSDKEVTKLEV